ncbi:flavoprotein [Longispora albida]|uniref:flavoprotein n=1 Tax=Longispora albida TaxID=203523 RepID=UPI00037AC02B|nr:flavoprotein [Longispora albida]
MSRVLYAIACGSPAAARIGRLVGLAQAEGWEVCVIATPDGAKFLDLPALTAMTGHPVRIQYKNPQDPDVLPAPDAMIVAPATVNTINKWAAGICDTLALGLIVEGIGLGLPIVAMPFTNRAHAAHPAFGENLARLSSWGVTVLWDTTGHRPHEPRAGEGLIDTFPWEQALAALPELATVR